VAPRIREFSPDEVIRKGKEGFLVAVGCRVPFKGRVRDDHGLARIRYGCRVVPADYLTEQKVFSLFGAGAVGLVGPGMGTRLLGTAYLAAITKHLAATAGDDASEEQYIDLPSFGQLVNSARLADGRGEVLEAGTVLSLLGTPQKEPFRKLLSDFSLTPDQWLVADEDRGTVANRWFKAQDQRAPLGCDLPLWQLKYKNNPLKEPDDTKAQRRYLIEVRLLVDDTFAEGEVDPRTKQPIPHTSPSSETFTIVVVPENELLARIAEEEETKYRELLKLVKPLSDNRDRLRDISFTLSAGAVPQGELNAMIARCDSLDEVLKTSHQDVKGIYSTYDRIVREMRTNQVSEHLTYKVFRDIYTPLEKVANNQFDRAVNALHSLRAALANQEVADLTKRSEAARPRAATARTELNELVRQIGEVLNKMQGLAEINALIKELDRIEKEEAIQGDLLRRVLKIRLEEALKKD
jgi:hypothetical protein